jgi:hypothetical protein
MLGLVLIPMAANWRPTQVPVAPEAVARRRLLWVGSPPVGAFRYMLPSTARFAISSGDTSSTWVATLHRCPKGSSN